MTDGVFNASFIIHYRRLLRSNFSHGHLLMGLQKKPTCLFARGETQSNQFAKETHLGCGYLFVNSAIGGVYLGGPSFASSISAAFTYDTSHFLACVRLEARNG